MHTKQFKNRSVTAGVAILALLVISGVVGAFNAGHGASGASEVVVPPRPMSHRQVGASGPTTTILQSEAANIAGALDKSNAPDTPARTTTTPAKVIKTGSLTVRVKKARFDRSFSAASRIAATHGGYVASSDSSSEDRMTTGTLELRVPADQFDAAYRELGAIGKITSRSQSGDDVTGQVFDLEARVRTLQAEEEAMRSLLAQAKSTDDVLRIRQQLLDVRTQIEQLGAQKANLEQSAAMSSITFTLEQVGAPVAKPTKPATGLAASWADARHATAEVVGTVIVGLGYVLPISVLLGLVIGVGAAVFRIRRKPALA